MTRKRFYRTAVVAARADGFGVELDGRPLRTPAGAEFSVPTPALAQAVAEEWLAQTDQIRPHTMPLTSLAATALDRVAPRRVAVVDQMVAYGGADLLCYRADAPGELAARQHAAWQPLLDWAADRWDARLVVTSGIMPVAQPDAALTALRRAVAARGDLELTALAAAVPACGSLVLGLALIEGVLGPDQAFEAAQIEQSYQMERWGTDPELTETRRRLRADLGDAATFLVLAHDRASAHAG